MNSVCEIDKSKQDALALCFIPSAVSDTHKRTAIYATLKTVEANPNISLKKLKYKLSTCYGLEETLVDSIIKTLTSAHVFPLLRWWRSDRLRKNQEKFFCFNPRMRGNCQQYLDYLEDILPELTLLTFNKD